MRRLAWRKNEGALCVEGLGFILLRSDVLLHGEIGIFSGTHSSPCRQIGVVESIHVQSIAIIGRVLTAN